MRRYFIGVLLGAAVSAGAIALLPAPQASEARLIAFCDGKLLAALEEDQFPQGCDWVEPIRLADEDATVEGN